MRVTAIAGAIVALAVAILVAPRSRDSGLRGVTTDAGVLLGAIGFFEAKLAADSIDASAAAALASRYVQRFQQAALLDDLARAEEVLERTLAYRSDRGSGLAQLSAIRLMQHDFTGAYAAAREAAQEQRTDETLGAWFDAALATGRFEEADHALTGMTRGLARQVRAAHWLDAGGDTEGAYQAMASVCAQLARSAVRPDLRAWCLTELAGLESARSGDRAAEQVYRSALRVMPGYRAALEGLADLAHARKEWADAVELYERIAVDAHPDLYLRLAEAEQAQGDTACANAWLAEFTRVTDVPGREALFAHPLAVYLAGHPDQHERALAVALRDVARRPAPESWDVLAWVHFRRGELDRALAASDRAVERTPTATMIYRRARIMDALARKDSATAYLREAIRNRAALEPTARVDLDRFTAGR